MQLRLALLSFFVATSAAAQEHPGQFGVDMLYYTDTNDVWVASPQVSARYALDPDEGSVGARVVVDAISAASVDVVTHATTRFDEVRYEGDLSASKTFGDFTPSLSYRFSREPDYVSHGGYIGLSSRLGTPDSVLSIGYGLTGDRVGRVGTPREAFEDHLYSHAADVSFTQTLSPRALVRVAYTLTAQRGYMEKPYRYVPLFLEGSVDGVALDIDNFDAFRTNLRPPEEVPDFRLRHAAAVRGLYYFPDRRTSLRLDYRFYGDDWGVLAHTIEPGVRARIGRHVQLAGYLRFYRQSAASFWKRVYVVQNTSTIPRYRSVDRDLSPYTTLTFGLRASWLADRWSIYVDGAVAQTWYDDFLYLDRMTALITQAGFRVSL